MIQDPIGPKTVDRLQVEGELLDLAWKHGADGKDATSAECFLESTCLFHGVRGKCALCPSAARQQTQRTKGK